MLVGHFELEFYSDEFILTTPSAASSSKQREIKERDSRVGHIVFVQKGQYKGYFGEFRSGNDSSVNVKLHAVTSTAEIALPVDIVFDL